MVFYIKKSEVMFRIFFADSGEREPLPPEWGRPQGSQGEFWRAQSPVFPRGVI